VTDPAGRVRHAAAGAHPHWTGPVSRQAFFAAYAAVQQMLGTVGRTNDALADVDFPDGMDVERTYFSVQSKLLDLYLDGLPVVPVSRCPFTGDRLDIPIDCDGLDGPWWDHQGAVRPYWERPATLVALTGAMRLAPHVESTPWLVCPGPDAPYVIPRLLDDDEVQAVVSTVIIGSHTGYVIAYFSGDPPAHTRPANDWGAPDSRGRGQGAEWGWDTCFDDPATFEFDLAPLVEARRLSWIRPGDDTWSVESAPTTCPYTSLEHSSRWQRVQEGTQW